MFKTFPNFTKLTLDHREEYEALIKNYPPISEISFTTLMTWWNLLGTAAVARLNDNLVFSYWLPGDEEGSGLSLIGTKNIDESLCVIFDYLKDKKEAPRLVHVSEFVVGHLRYPELFNLSGERDYDEYVFSVSELLSSSSPLLPKVEKFLRNAGKKKIAVKSLDLRSSINQALLMGCAREWRSAHTFTQPKLVDDSMSAVILQAYAFDVDNVCVYVDGELEGFYLLQRMLEPTYTTANYSAYNPKIVGLPEYMLYMCAKRLTEQGVTHVNLDFDLDSHFLRTQQLVLRPVNYFRKYTIEPVGRSYV